MRDGDGWRSWSTIPQEDALTTGLAGITADGKTVYMRDSRDRNTGALFAIEAETGERRLVHEDPRADVIGAMVHPETGVVQAALVIYLRNEWTVIDPAVAGDLEKLKAIGEGDVNVVSRTLADDKWVVVHTSSTAPPIYYLYDRAAGHDAALVRDAARAQRREHGADAHGRDQEPRRPHAAELLHAAARQRSGRRRQARHAGADGAVRARRPVGPRRLGLQSACTSGSRTAATRCWR